MASGKSKPPPSKLDQTHTSPARKHWLDKATFVFAMIAAGATAFAAYYTSCQWATADDTEKRSLRAYVGTSPGSIENFGTPDQFMIIERKNYGTTPGYNLINTSFGADIMTGNTVVGMTGDCERQTNRNLPTIFPSMSLSMKISVWNKNWKKEEFDAIAANTDKFNNGAKFVYWGTICYTDAFSVAHYTNFCWGYRGKSMTAADSAACLFHNDSD
jgi:hypothetical protein